MSTKVLTSQSLHAPNVDDTPETATLHRLTSHAELARLTNDPALDARIIARGFDGVAAIARASRKDFLAGVRGLLTPDRAAAVYRQARAQLATARTAYAGLLTDSANGFAASGGLEAGGVDLSDIVQGALSGEMPTALSPAAYLCDLIEYAVQHVRRIESGVRGTYFDGKDIDSATPKLSRTDRTVNFEWGSGSPAPSIPAERFSARWEGQLLPRYTETYILTIESDDGVRLWIDDQLLIDNWTDHARTRDHASIDLVAGHHYDVRLEFYENDGEALVKLFWSSESQLQEIVPASQLSAAAPIDLDELEDLLQQPLGALRGDSAGAEETVKQARVAIEVLRAYLARYALPAAGSAQRTVLAAAERAYRLLVYTTLLTKLGTSFEELRLTRTADAATRAALADRLGIKVARLDALLLDPQAASGDNALTEARLAAIFGVADTTERPRARRERPLLETWRRERLRADWTAQDATDDDYRSGKRPIIDPDVIGPEDFRAPTPNDPAFARWLERRHWIDSELALCRRQRESQGFDAVLARVFGRPATDLEALRSALAQSADASAHTRAAAALVDLALAPDAFERLMTLRAADIAERTGGDTVSADEWDDAYSIIVQAEKAKPLATWISQENGSIAFGLERFRVAPRAPQEGPWPPRFVLDRDCGRPAIDPLQRDRLALEPPLAGDAALALWEVRRAWLDETAAKYRRFRSGAPSNASGLAVAIDAALGPGSADLDALAAALASSNPATAADAARRIRADLHLDLSGFRRLVAIRAAESAGSLPSDDEFEECCTILLTAAARSRFSQWVKEEAALPLLDPDVTTIDALPRGGAGLPARDLWHHRRAQVDALIPPLTKELASQPFFEVMQQRFGAGRDAFRDLADSAAHGRLAAIDAITDKFHLTLEQFARLLDLGTQIERGEDAAAAVADAAAILASAQKIDALHPAWLREEHAADGGLAYWNVIPAAQPRRLSSADARAAWLTALAQRTARPILDPDIVSLDQLVDPTPADATFMLWSARQQWVANRLEDLSNAALTQGPGMTGFDGAMVLALVGEEGVVQRRAAVRTFRAAYGFSDTLFAVLGESVAVLGALDTAAHQTDAAAADARRTITDQLCLGVDELRKLLQLHERERNHAPIALAEWEDAERVLARAALAADIVRLSRDRKAGIPITADLQPYGFDAATYDALLRMRALVVAGATVLGSEWEAVCDSLVQAEKVRRFAAWREEERTAGIVIGPDRFSVATVTETTALVAAMPAPPPRRFSTEAARAFIDLLQARIDQDAAIAPAMRGVVAAAEEVALPVLRDALIAATNAGGATAADKAVWMAGRTLLDMAAAGATETTRIAQAIESLQGFIWSARTGQLAVPLQVYRLDAAAFDEDWKWIGSYETWRAAMLVFMYPDTLLLPSLRRWRSGRFADLVASLRAPSRLSPGGARDAAQDYAAYFRDVCNLQLAARVPTITYLKQKQQRRRTLTFWSAGTGFLSYESATGAAEFHAVDQHAQATLVASATELGIGAGWDQIVVDARFGKNPGDAAALFCYNSATGEGAFFRASQRAAGTPGAISRVSYYTGLRIGARVICAEFDYNAGPLLLFYDPARGEAELQPVHDCTLVQGGEIGPTVLTGLIPNALPACGKYDGQGPNDLLLYDPAAGSLEIYRSVGHGSLDINHSAYPTYHHYDGFPTNATVLTDGLMGLFLYEPSGGHAHHYVWTRFEPGTGKLAETFFSTVGGTPPLHFGAEKSAQAILAWVDASWTPSLAFYQEATGTLTFHSTGAGGTVAATSKNWNIAWTAIRRQEFYIARGEGAEGTGYWSRRAETDSAEYGQTLWEPIPGFGRVERILGAVPYTASPGDQKLYAVAIVSAGNGQRGLIFTSYDLLADAWGTATDMQIQLSKDARAYLQPTTGSAAPTVGVVELHGSVTGYSLQDGRWIPCPIVISAAPDPGPIGDLAPSFAGPYLISDRLSDTDREVRRQMVTHGFDASAATRNPNGTYFEEAWYFVPLQTAIELQKQGQYVAALDWFRTIYDYAAPPAERKVFPALALEEHLSDVLHRATDWIRDPLDPHLIARTRANSYTRYTLFAIARCLLDYADGEFTADTAESIDRARTLYQTAHDLLQRSPELAPREDTTVNLLDEVDVEVRCALVDVAPGLLRAWSRVRAALAPIFAAPDRAGTERRVIDAVRSSETWHVRLARVQQIVDEQRGPAPVARSVREVLQARADREQTLSATFEAAPAIARAFDAVRREAGGGLAVDGADDDVARFAPRLLGEFRIPENPVWRSLCLRAEVNLFKLRSGRNFAGMVRALEVYAAPTDTTGLPNITAGGQLYLGTSPVLHPTPYRFKTLVEYAKQLVQLAAPLEAEMLAAIEKEGAEALTLLKARQELAVANAGVSLQETRMVEAEAGVDLGQLQQQRSVIQQEHFDRLIGADLLDDERQALDELKTAIDFKIAATTIGGIGTIGQAIGGAVVGSYIGPEGTAAGAILGGIGGLLTGGGGILEGISAVYSMRSGVLSTRASYERRAQEWRFDRDLATQDIAIGEQQVTIARDHVTVVAQERAIAALQATHARAVIDYLGSRFLNVEMFHWMAGVLEEAYHWFLQQATAVASLAEDQLAFERHEPMPPFIQSDYWTVPVENGAATSGAASAEDRRGLTGSARLLRDTYQLDAYAFETNKRKLQISRTVSLAQLAPIAFQRFRETGLLTIRTPMELFDRDFPGHYLRLIKRVRTSVVALVPPTEGVKAMLSTNGISRVVVGGDTFQPVVVRRDPETVALSATTAASGVFELDSQPEMLLPFEATGVDTTWEFRMPRAANPFDYATIADVLLTIDYTALNSFDYYNQVVRNLDRTTTGERAYSFRLDFADAWYDLHNPAQSGTPLAVRFATGLRDFAPNLDDVSIEQLTLYFARRDGEGTDIPVSQLRFLERGAPAAVGGGATSVDGIVSTRRGNAASWTTILGRRPDGEWELALDDQPQVRAMLEGGGLEDMLFVVGYRGHMPAYPA